jgi:hypothetical protein
VRPNQKRFARFAAVVSTLLQVSLVATALAAADAAVIASLSVAVATTQLAIAVVLGAETVATRVWAAVQQRQAAARLAAAADENVEPEAPPHAEMRTMPRFHAAHEPGAAAPVPPPRTLASFRNELADANRWRGGGANDVLARPQPHAHPRAIGGPPFRAPPMAPRLQVEPPLRAMPRFNAAVPSAATQPARSPQAQFDARRHDLRFGAAHRPAPLPLPARDRAQSVRPASAAALPVPWDRSAAARSLPSFRDAGPFHDERAYAAARQGPPPTRPHGPWQRPTTPPSGHRHAQARAVL